MTTPTRGPGAASQPDSDLPATKPTEPGPPPPAANQPAGGEIDAPAERTGEAPDSAPDRPSEDR